MRPDPITVLVSGAPAAQAQACGLDVQDGHLSDLLGFTPTGFLEPTVPILMLAILFGLSIDYEVFLLSRVREEWDQTGDNTRVVALGLQRTGRIITAAELLVVVVNGGFATGRWRPSS